LGYESALQVEGRSRHGLALALSISPQSPVPIESQLCQQIRSLILSGTLKAGTRLPSSRVLSEEIGCSRTPVLAAFEKLAAEGYIETKPRSGIRVAAGLDVGHPVADSGASREAHGPHLSGRGSELAQVTRRFGQPTSSMPGHPAIEGFPFDVWGKISARIWRFPSSLLVWGDDPAGYRPLRQALADYLRVVRGLACEADDIVITSGTKQAIDLVGRIMLDPGDEAVVEDPGWPSWWLLQSAGVKLTPVAVDEQGLRVEDVFEKAPDARLVAVSPSHQFPLGSTMSLQRRLALLKWARDGGRLILEDDYDSEFRFSGDPLSSLKSLDTDGNVIYTGTFAKSLFPSIRMGYMVLPRHLVGDFLDARGAIDTFPPITVQPVLAAFIAEGHMAKHVRNMRRLYRERHDALIGSVTRYLGKHVDVIPTEMGLTLPLLFRDPSIDDRLAAEAFRKVGLTAFPISAAFVRQKPVKGVMIGLATVPEYAVDEAVRRLRDLLFPA
jgi:GntR family transcriptional regulator / MocR family aminotransferase